MSIVAGLSGFAVTPAPAAAPPPAAGAYFTNSAAVIAAYPTLSSPSIIELPDDITPTAQAAYGSSAPGNRYYIALDNSTDYIIQMAAGATALPLMLQIEGGRHVVLRGLKIALATPAGGAPGMIGGNVLPHMVHSTTIRANDQLGTLVVEGCDIDALGHACDILVVRGTQTYAYNKANRHILMINSNIRGWSGDVPVHGDLFQNQGSVAGDNIGDLMIENVTAASAQEGIVIHVWPEADWPTKRGCRHLHLRNIHWKSDPRYAPDGVNYGSTLDGDPITHELVNYWISYGNNAAAGDWQGAPYVTIYEPAQVIYGWPGSIYTPHAEIHQGHPPSTFAPLANVGLSYVTPF